MEFHVLREVGFTDGTANKVKLTRSGEWCVLATLALQPGKAVSIDTLIEHAWGESPPAHAAETIATYVRTVRHQLGRCGGDPDWVRACRPRGYMLAVDPALVDHIRFTRMVREARQHARTGATLASIRLFHEALQLFHGIPLSNVNNDWAERQRHTLEMERLAAHTDLLEQQLLCGQYAEVTGGVRAILADKPPTDKLIILGMYGLARSGRHAEIGSFLHRASHRMWEAAAIRPSAEVTALAQQLQAQPNLPLTMIDRSPTPSPDLSSSARDERPSSIHAAPTAIRTLRQDLMAFTGREDELSTIVDAINPTSGADGHRSEVFIIDGMPGVGKTTFAMHVAHTLADRFSDGQVLLELNGHFPGRLPVEPVNALGSLLQLVGVTPREIPRSLEDRAAMWRNTMADRCIVLILDDAANREQIYPLLPGSTPSLVIVTSRRRLPLLENSQSISLATLSSESAAEMLVKMTRRKGRSETLHDVCELVRLCGYLPLAISLMAGQLRSHPTWSARHLASKLATMQDIDRIHDMRAGDLAVTPAFELSYRDLSSREQLLFRRLSLIPGHEVDAYAAAALTGGTLSAARQDLESLYENHLVEETVPDRYRLHDLIRSYSSMVAVDEESNSRRDALDRILAYYAYCVAVADKLVPRFNRSLYGLAVEDPIYMPCISDSGGAIRWLEAERINLGACVSLAASMGNVRLAGHLASSMNAFLQLCGHWDHALEVHQIVLDAATCAKNARLQAIFQVYIGQVHHLTREYDTAMQMLAKASQWFDDADDPAGKATALTDIGRVYYLTHNYAEAKKTLALAVDLNVRLGDKLGWATTLTNLGRAHRLAGDFPAASTALTTAHKLYVELDNVLGPATTLNNLGTVQTLSGDYESASATLGDAMALYSRIGHKLGCASAFNRLGRVHRLAGNYEIAEETFTRAYDIYVKMNDRLGLANVLNNLGRIQRLKGRYSDAVETLNKARSVYSDLGDRLGVANVLASLGRVQRLRGDDDDAISSLNTAYDEYSRLGVRDGQAHALVNLGRVLAIVGQYDEAIAKIDQARQISSSLQDNLGIAEAVNNMGNVYRMVGNSDTAMPLLHRAVALYDELGVRDGHAEALINMGDLHLQEGRFADAGKYYTHGLDMVRDQVPLEEARALEGLAKCMIGNSQISEARTTLQKAVAIYARLNQRAAETARALLLDITQI